MSENAPAPADSAGGPASPENMVASGAPKGPDGQYTKAILKGEIKVTKLNSDNYQSWADGMELLLDAKMLWRLVNGTAPIPDPETRPIDNSAWKFDDAQAKAWTYVNIEDPQHNHLKGQTTSHATWETLRKLMGPKDRAV